MENYRVYVGNIDSFFKGVGVVRKKVKCFQTNFIPEMYEISVSVTSVRA